MTIATMVATVPPIRPSTLLLGLIQARSGVCRQRCRATRAPMSLATTPMASRHSVSVPMLVLTKPAATGKPEPFEYRRISAANEPRKPIHTTPSVVMAMFGIGPASRLLAPMNVIAAATNAEGDDQRQRLLAGPVGGDRASATQATMPMIVAGR